MLIIAVVGDGQCDAATASEAEAVGRALAEAGATLVCGGLGGVMEAACRGAKSAGGTTIGILPGLDRRAANPYVDIPIVTGMDQARNLIIVRTAQAVVAVRGGYGTLSEIAHALKAGVPVVGLSTWELVKPGERLDAIHRASTPEDAARLAVRLARSGGNG
ncbi:MAG: TIGR00725 family protein [Chloroflexi bacterium]|nr:MAG: TIGR00725 family protein [Chloroflexota bacterium]